VPVTFAVTGGGGRILNGATFNTDASGIATVGGWLLGQLTGSTSLLPNTLTATAALSGIAGNGLTFTANAVGNRWQTFASMPTPRQAPVSGVINGKLYVAGGYGDDGSGNGNHVLATLEVYDPVNDSWKPLASMPTARTGAAATVINDMLYVVGGDVGGLTHALEVYDPSADRWATLAPMPTARFEFAVESVNGILYALGGNTSGTATGIVEAYDPKTDSWTSRASLPAPQVATASAVIKGIVYIAGDNPTASVAAYDPATDTWTTKTPTAARIAHTGAVLGNLFYVMGGFYRSQLMADVEAYDPTTDSWSTRAQLPTIRANVVTGVINGVIYAVGGNTPNGVSVSTVEAYQP
jgi:N-acetylneuraminic acid mutarotase